MKAEIDAYALAWHEEKGYAVSIKKKGTTDWKVMNVSAANFCALGMILRESPVFFSDGWIHTGEEPTGK